MIKNIILSLITPKKGKIMKRIISFLLLLAMLISVFVGCASNGDSGSSGKNPTNKETEEIDYDKLTAAERRKLVSDDLPDMSFNNREFRIVSDAPKTFELFAEEEIGEPANDSVWARNEDIQDRFDVKITYNEVLDPTDFVIQTVSTFDDAMDLVALNAYQSTKIITAEVVQDWSEMPYNNFEKPWYNQETNDAMTFNGKIYNVTMSLGITQMMYTLALFANTRIINDYGWSKDKLVKFVDNDDWTYEKFLQVVSSIYDDTNGNSKKDDGDLFGYQSGYTNTVDGWTTVFNQNITDKDVDGNLTPVLMNEKAVSICEKIYALCYNNKATNFYLEGDIRDAADFASAKVAIAPLAFNDAFNALRTMNDVYAILPYPKWDDQQESYRTHIIDRYSVFALPRTLYEDSHVEFASIIIEALNAESYKEVYPAYYDIALKGKYTEDPTDARMVDLIMDGAYLDPAYMLVDFTHGISYTLRECIFYQNSDFVSMYNQKSTGIEDTLENFVDYYED